MGQEHEDDEKRTYSDAHAGGKNAQAAASVFRGGGPKLVESKDQIQGDAEQVECVDDMAGEVAGAGQKRSIASAVILHIHRWVEDGDKHPEDAEEDPLDPSGPRVDAGAFRKVDTEEEQGGSAG